LLRLNTVQPIDIIIYHNPACGTSRNTLAMIRNAGIEPHVIEYLKTPPARAISCSSSARIGGVFRYSITCGSMPALRIIANVLRDVPQAGLW